MLKNSFNCESSNLIYVFICQECKEEYIGETGCLLKGRRNIYRQHMPQYEQLVVEEHLRACGDGKFHMFPFFNIIQENKWLRKSYGDYFIDKFKLFLDKKTWVTKPPKVAGSWSYQEPATLGGFATQISLLRKGLNLSIK